MSNKVVSNSRSKAAVIKTLLLAVAAAPAAQAQDAWKLEITPYIWAASVDADVIVRGRGANIDTDPEDTFDALKVGGSLLSVLQYGSVVVYAQGDYLKLDTDELDNAPTRGELEVDATIATLGLGYQFPGWSDRQTFDVLLGARYFKVQSELTLDRSGTFRGDQDYLDPVLIVRPSIRISDRWRFNPTLSYGTGGDSEESYELWPQVQFDINDNIALRFGYRKLHYEVESGRRGNAFDGAFEGGMLGLGGKFGYRAKPVAQLAPEPPPPALVTATAPPPPPPAPKDTDSDGIVDAEDLCPSTSPADRVDAVGCGYNMRIAVYFDNDSALLDEKSKAELDRLVELLKRSPTISGTIEAHTDSVGKAAYNMKLSERRAKAVAEYMFERGIARERLDARGFGETQPASDNGTAAGRAENRRVLLRRTDAI